MDFIYSPDLDAQQRRLLLNMRRMTPWQQGFMVRLAKRLAEDKDGSFVALLERSTPVICRLFASHGHAALDRWLRRHTLKVVE